jgi:hypothetical protein
VFNCLVVRGIDRDTAQRFSLQALMCLFAEDIGLLEKYFFARLLDECKTGEQAYDLIGGLFVEMNTPGKTQGGRFKGVDYFNGGLFREPARIELASDEINLLKNAARSDWSKVRPEIFGAIFEHSLGKEQRHAYGAHFTSPADIMKIVGPTIVEPWREQIESAKTLKRLDELLARLENFRVLDPACGSGNFLYIAYRELKRLEARIYERSGEFASRNAAQRPFGFVTARNFHGMDIQPFAVELAKVTMMLAHKLAIDELHVTENALPLDNLDANFSIGDALIAPDGTRTEWPKADVIIGNPPFLDARKMTMERGRDYVAAIEKAYPEIPRRADYCSYWFRRAHDHLPSSTANDPVTGRAGLVGTQNIRNNESRKAGLDAICADGTVIEAVENQPWSGEANVHVSIANWIKTQDDALLPKTRRLWFKSSQSGKNFDLDCRESAYINSSLSDQTDVAAAAVLNCNRSPKRCFEGQQPGHLGFRLTTAERTIIGNSTIIYLYLNGDGLLSGRHATEPEYIIDFGDRDMLKAASYRVEFDWVKNRVLADWTANADSERDETGKTSGEHQGRLEKWWQLKRRRPELIAQLNVLPRYIACSRVTKRPIFSFVSSSVHPDSSLTCFAFADDYSFGILQSAAHWQWFVAKCSKLTERLRYTPESVFDTFPWPQAPSEKQIDAIAAAGREIRRIRAEALQTMHGGLRALYRTLDLPGKNPLRDAHAKLDAAVLAAYGFSAKGDLLQQLLDLNRTVAAKVGAGDTATAPGVPPIYPDPMRLLTSDCLGATRCAEVLHPVA